MFRPPIVATFRPEDGRYYKVSDPHVRDKFHEVSSSHVSQDSIIGRAT